MDRLIIQQIRDIPKNDLFAGALLSGAGKGHCR